MNENGNWSVSFTIIVNGIQIDFTELSEKSRVHIIHQLITGEMKGTLYKDYKNDLNIA